MNRSLPSRRVLSIHPSTRGFGFAVLEGPEVLVDWGICETREDKNGQAIRRITDKIQRYQPDVIVMEDHYGEACRRCGRVKELIAVILKAALERKIKVRLISRTKVRQAFSDLGPKTKHRIACDVAARFPELTPRLPPARKPWMPEHHNMSIFDALAFALAYFHFLERKQRLRLARTFDE